MYNAHTSDIIQKGNKGEKYLIAGLVSIHYNGCTVFSFYLGALNHLVDDVDVLGVMLPS